MLNVTKDGARTRYKADPNDNGPPERRQWIKEYTMEIWDFSEVVRTMADYERDFNSIQRAIHDDRSRGILHVISISPMFDELDIFSKDDEADAATAANLLTIANKAIAARMKQESKQ